MPHKHKMRHQLPIVGVAAKFVVSLAIGGLQLYSFSTIVASVLSGGSGKNGSTIAVS